MRACVRRTHLLRSTTFRLGLLTTVDDVLSELSELRQQRQVKGLEAVREVVELRMHEEGDQPGRPQDHARRPCKARTNNRRGDEVDELTGELNAMLAGLIAQERQVTDDIAHDLRTPLARLRQRLELARRKVRSVGEYKQAVDGTIKAADATSRLAAADR